MKKILILTLLAALVGCEYAVPLVSTPTIDIDKKVIGLWQRSASSGQKEKLLVLPLNEKEYLVSYPAHSKDAMFARGSLWKNTNEQMTLVQLDWLGTAQAKLPENNQTFQFFSYSLNGDTIRIRLLNSDVISKDVTDSNELAASIQANAARRELFREEMVFKKLK